MRSRADSLAAYERFVSRVRANGSAFAVEYTDDNSPALCDSHEIAKAQVLPLFSDRAYAERIRARYGNSAGVVEISREDLLAKTLPFMLDAGFAVGPNWDADLAGVEIDPAELRARLRN